MRVALHSILRPGAEAEYEADHATIPADLAETFARIGIHDWTIWRSGRDLFHLVECDDFAAAIRALATDEANARWQAFIGRHVDHFSTFREGDDEQAMPEVWSLSAQHAG